MLWLQTEELRSQNDSCKSSFIAEERSNSKVKLHFPPHSHLSFLSTVCDLPIIAMFPGVGGTWEATTWHYYDCPLEMTTLSSIRTLSRHFWSLGLRDARKHLDKSLCKTEQEADSSTTQ